MKVIQQPNRPAPTPQQVICFDAQIDTEMIVTEFLFFFPGVPKEFSFFRSVTTDYRASATNLTTMQA
uniref:Uncharacterized protein n=1 Tax=Setaria italica TaxID=4555 RepID=K3ZKU4_SETIT